MFNNEINNKSLEKRLQGLYGPIIVVECLKPDFEARGEDNDLFVLIHKPCLSPVARFSRLAQSDIIVNAQNDHICPEESQESQY